MWLSAIEACSSCSTIHIPQQGVAAACAVGLFACVEPDGSNALDDPHLDERLYCLPFVFRPDGSAVLPASVVRPWQGSNRCWFEGLQGRKQSESLVTKRWAIFGNLKDGKEAII